jgi:hypothetical protein
VTESLQSLDHGVRLERRSGIPRRSGDDCRAENEPATVERRSGERRKTQRRRQIDPTTCERDYTGDELEFMRAIDEYKRISGRMFPTCSEILEVVRSLGYVRLSEDGQPYAARISGEPAKVDEHDEEAMDNVT